MPNVHLRKQYGKNSKLVDEFNRRCPQGSEVNVLRDDGSVFRTKTRSAAWLLGCGTPVILLDGITGGFALERVLKINGEASEQ